MDRVRDHLSFIVWFVGLSYIALGPVAVTLSPGLHLVGMLAALWVVLRIMFLLASKLWRAIAPRITVRAHLHRWRSHIRAIRRRRDDPAPSGQIPTRYVPRRRDFGLRH